jgi:hypothetical protein
MQTTFTIYFHLPSQGLTVLVVQRYHDRQKQLTVKDVLLEASTAAL